MLNYFGGPEGGGKSALMTYYSRKHYLLHGEVWAFPGYELKNNTGKVVSKLIYPEEIMSNIENLQFVMLDIDEITNFINHHAWQSKLADLLAYGVAAQRRKLNMVINATGPQIGWLPPDLRMMFHLVFNCRDKHWRDKSIPRGEQIAFSITDNRGILSGYPGFTTKERTFWPKEYFKYWDTLAIIDPKYQNRRYKQEKDDIHLDYEGNILKEDRNTPVDDINIAQMKAELVAQKKKKLEGWELHKILKDMGYTFNNKIRYALQSQGIHYDLSSRCYLIS